MYLLYWLALLICVHISSGGTTPQSNDPKCAELDKPGWKIDNLQNTTLDAWPWQCLQSRYTNDSLRVLVSNSGYNDIYAAARQGSIGFVQYYAQKKDFPADVNIPDLLEKATESGNLRLLKFLVEEKSLPVHQNDYNLTIAAARSGNVDLIKYLINEKNVTTNTLAYNNSTPVHFAAVEGKFEALLFFVQTLRLPIDSVNSKGYTPALLAAGEGNVTILKYLIDNGANLDIRSPENRTLLHETAINGSVEASRYLIDEKKVSVDPMDKDEWTPAFHAAAGDHVPLLKYLVEKGANLKHRIKEDDDENSTILHEAVTNGALRTTKYLVEEKNMSVELQDGYRRTPVFRAARKGNLELVKYLAGERNANVFGREFFGLTLLHWAVVGRNLDVIKYLVDVKGMSRYLEEEDAVGLTVALQAARSGAIPILKYLLMEKHANMSAVDTLGRNLLHTAASNLQFETMQYLIEDLGFNPRGQTDAGKTAYDIVSKYKATVRAGLKEKILDYLKQKGGLSQNKI